MKQCSTPVKYYIHGRNFNSEEEFVRFCDQWKDMPADLDEFRRFLSDRFKEAEWNAYVNPRLTNRELYKILQQSINQV